MVSIFSQLPLTDNALLRAYNLLPDKYRSVKHELDITQYFVQYTVSTRVTFKYYFLAICYTSTTFTVVRCDKESTSTF